MPYRDEDEARMFKPMGDLGQIVRLVLSTVVKVTAKVLTPGPGMGSPERNTNSRMFEAFRYGV